VQYRQRELTVSARNGVACRQSAPTTLRAMRYRAVLRRWAFRPLMPRKFLDDDPRTLTIEVEDARAVQELARAYIVSTQAMSVRLLKLYGRRSSPVGQRGLFEQA
jgi:hypothetical protein